MASPDPVPMTTAALVTRFFTDVLNGENPAAAAQILAPDFTVHHPLYEKPLQGPGDLTQLAAAFHAAFPDLRYSVVDIIADDDRAAVQWTATGTHQGDFFHVAPTGIRATIGGTDVFHAANDVLTESWVSSDIFGLFRKLGAFPPLPLTGDKPTAL